MSKLTFGIEMEMFIKNTIIIQKIIREEMEINNCNTFQELLTFIISKTTYNSDTFNDDIESQFTNNIDNKSYNIAELNESDYYLYYKIILIIIYIICKNNKKLSFSLYNIIKGYGSDIIYFKDNKNITWHYDVDTSVSPYEDIKTYRTIYDNFPQILSYNDVIPYTEFVSGIYNNPLEVKEGIFTLISALTDLKLTPLHSEGTSNHIHFSIKKETENDKGIKDSYLVFCITYVFYVLQNFIYLICLPERRTSDYCAPLELNLNHWSKSFDNFTLDEFFNILITMEIPKGDEEDYLNHSKINRLTGLLSKTHNIKLKSKELIKKIKTLNIKIKKITLLPSDIKNKPFKNLIFEHQLIVLRHLYHKFSNCKMDNNLKKYNLHIQSIINPDRYKILNLKKLSERKSCTLELRVKHGSNDATEIANFCILIEKFVNLAEQMVLNKHIPILKSLATILNITEKELLAFKAIEPENLHLHYISQKPLLKKLLNTLYKTETDNIKYWLKQLKRINKLKDPNKLKIAKSLNSKSSSISSKFLESSNTSILSSNSYEY
jgi:hypothetical protein